MTPNQVDDILSKLLKSMRNEVKEAGDAYRELAAAYNDWKSDKTQENWADVEYRANGAMMWIIPPENPLTDPFFGD